VTRSMNAAGQRDQSGHDEPLRSSVLHMEVEGCARECRRPPDAPAVFASIAVPASTAGVAI
jgi:hypothetical protein